MANLVPSRSSSGHDAYTKRYPPTRGLRPHPLLGDTSPTSRPVNHDKYRGVSIEALFEPARAGDQGALDELFRRTVPILGRIAQDQRIERARLGIARPSDITQETMQSALQKFESFKGKTGGEWEGWLKTILSNCIKQSYRAAHQLKRDADATVSLEEQDMVPAGEKSPSQVVAHQEEQRRLVVHLSHLPPDQGEAIMLFYLSELSVAEVASRMSRTEGAIGGLLQRGLKALRMRMNPAPAEASGEASAEPGPTEEAEAAFLSYLRGRGAGEEADREAFLDEHPACADELRSMLELAERIRAIWAAAPESEGSRG